QSSFSMRAPGRATQDRWCALGIKERGTSRHHHRRAPRAPQPMPTIDRTLSGPFLAYAVLALTLLGVAIRRLGVEAGSAWTVSRPTGRPLAVGASGPIATPTGPVRDHSTSRRSLPPHAGSPSGGRAAPVHEARDSHQCESTRDPRRHPGG